MSVEYALDEDEQFLHGRIALKGVASPEHEERVCGQMLTTPIERMQVSGLNHGGITDYLSEADLNQLDRVTVFSRSDWMLQQPVEGVLKCTSGDEGSAGH